MLSPALCHGTRPSFRMPVGINGLGTYRHIQRDRHSSLVKPPVPAQATGHATAVPRPCHCHPRKPCQICQQPSCQSEPNPHGQWLGQGLATSWTDLMLSPALCDRAHAWLPDAPTAWTFNRSDGRHVAQLPDARRDRWCCTHADHNAESDTMQGSTGQTDTERTRKDKQSSLLSTRQAARQAAGQATAVPASHEMPKAKLAMPLPSQRRLLVAKPAI
jgi:hypothetical protein